jgi:hypothetical protein
MVTREHLIEHAYRLGIPDYMHDGLVEFILNGRPVGNFLTAVLSNNLKEACGRADETNLQILPNYVKFLYNHAPIGCWGDEERMESWMERGGLVGVLNLTGEKV